MNSKDLLRAPPARQKPGTLGQGEPECPECNGPLDDDGFCPVCEPGDDELEIDV